MFAKLLKHEWMGCREVLGVLCAITLASGATVGLTSVYLTYIDGQKSYILAELLLFLAALAIGICAAVGFFYLIWRFYQSRFTEEGYLTFTLPVNNHQQLLAVILNILRGTFLVWLATLGALLLVLLISFIAFCPTSPDFRPTSPDFTEYVQAWIAYFPEILAGINWRGMGEVLLFCLVWWIAQVIQLMFSVTVGAIAARKHKLLTTATVYFGICFAQLWGQFTFGFGNSTLGPLGYAMPMSLLTIAVGYFGMHWLMRKKLNLT